MLPCFLDTHSEVLKDEMSRCLQFALKYFGQKVHEANTGNPDDGYIACFSVCLKFSFKNMF